LFYGGKPGRTWGWGVLNGYLSAKLAKRTTVLRLDEKHPLWNDLSLPGALFNPLPSHDFEPFCPARGRRNFGYAIFEHELTPRSLENSRRYDRVFTASSWCLQQIQANGIINACLLIQGVDHELFQMRPMPDRDNGFVIFSGGKLEFRKGQDLVLRAFQILQDKYDDMTLVTAWYNYWPRSMASISLSPHVRFEPRDDPWISNMEAFYRLNGVDPGRVTTISALPHHRMADVYARSHVGLFPNRCEGGTNLVLMEFMATGRPAIATNATGHKDILTESNSLLLRDFCSTGTTSSSGQSHASWVEPSLDEIIAKVEFAYHHPQQLQKIGEQAARDMTRFTWEAAATDLWSRLAEYL
jgi:glycosyltransferase involved in cell wall biosynthesis